VHGGADHAPTAVGDLVTVVLAVDGMTCGSCVTHVTEALLAVPGVVSARVELDAGVAEVVSASAPAVELCAAVQAAGYEAWEPSIPDAEA
jgi:copper chaperone